MLAVPEEFYLPLMDGRTGFNVRVFFTGEHFAIEEPITGWWIAVHAWSRKQFAAGVGHLDIIAWRDGESWVLALPESNGAVRLDDQLLRRVLDATRDVA